MWPEFSIQLKNGTLRWTGEYEDKYRLTVLGPAGQVLAMEGERSGLFTYMDAVPKRYALPVSSEILKIRKNEICWRQKYADDGLVIEGQYRKIDDESVMVVHRFKAMKDLKSPHLSWGLRMNMASPINRYHFTQSPTQMAYSFADSKVTLWMISTYDHARPISRFVGCQALVAENPDPLTLEFHTRTPPGFVDLSKEPCVLKAGQTAELRSIIAIRPGFYYEHMEVNERLQPLEAHKPRYPYRHYVDMAVKNFHDPKKYHKEHKGILYYTAVDGDVKNPRIQYWTEGPGWGGACDAENAYNTLLYGQKFAKASERQQFETHARRMLDGWLTNPRFRVPKNVYCKKPGDMDEAIIATGWFPDCIWTAAQADFILRLSDIHAMTGWSDCLETAKNIGRWVLRHQAVDGSIPTLWQFPIKYSKELLGDWRPTYSLCLRKDSRAQVLVEGQPASSCFLIVALFHLHKVDPQGPWYRAALKLLKWTVARLNLPLAEFGNGEFDYLVFRARSMDPTGLSYILWGLAEAYDHLKDEKYLKLLRRYMNTLLAYGVTYDCHETLRRPESKVTLKKYGTDIKLAGGITHANWMPVYKRGFGGRFNLLMNRNEMAEGMFQAWRVTKDRRYRRWLEAYVNWQTYFQFTREVPGSLVTTRGSCPQNHFWTTDFGNWNNDYALTAHKWVGTYLKLISAGIDGEKNRK